MASRSESCLPTRVSGTGVMTIAPSGTRYSERHQSAAITIQKSWRGKKGRDTASRLRSERPSGFTGFWPEKSGTRTRSCSKSNYKTYRSQSKSKTCAGGQTQAWSPLTRTGAPKSKTMTSMGASGFQTRASSVRGSNYDVEMGAYRAKKSGCPCWLWLLLIPLLLAVGFGVYYVAIRDTSPIVPPNDESEEKKEDPNPEIDNTGFHPVASNKRYEWQWQKGSSKNNFTPATSWWFEQCQRSKSQFSLIDLGQDKVFEIDVKSKTQNGLKWKNGEGHTMAGNRYQQNGKTHKLFRVEKAGKQSERFTPSHHWQYQDDGSLWGSSWQRYPQLVSDWFEYCLKHNIPDPTFDIGEDRMFSCDLAQQKQHSLTWGSNGHGANYQRSGKTRKMKRVEGKATRGSGNAMIRILIKGVKLS